MEFIVSRNRLLAALKHTRRVIKPNNDIKALRCFVFTFDGDVMTVQAANADELMQERMALEQPAVDPRPIAIWYDEILRPVSSLDDQPLHFTIGESQLAVRHSCGTFRIPLADYAQEFLDFTRSLPELEADDCLMLEYEAPALRSVLKRCKFAMAQDELRPSMNGVYMNLTPDYADYVSSDGHKLVRVRKSAVRVGDVSVTASLILPSRVVNTMLAVLPRTGDVDFSYLPPIYEEVTKGDKKEKVCKRRAAASFTIDDGLTLVFRPVDGRYPAYWSVIPDYRHFEMCLDRLQLIKSVDRLSFFSVSSGLERFSLNADNTVRINAEDADFEYAAEESLPCDIKRTDGKEYGGGVSFGMKGVSLSETLKVLPSEKVVFSVIDSTRAIIIQPATQPDTEELTMLLMPMLIND